MADKPWFRTEDLDTVASQVADILKQSEHNLATVLRMKQQALRKKYVIVLTLLATASFILGMLVLVIGPTFVSGSMAENFAGMFLETALSLGFAAIFAFWYERQMAKIDDSAELVSKLAHARPHLNVTPGEIEAIYNQTQHEGPRSKDEQKAARDIEESMNRSRFEIEDQD